MRPSFDSSMQQYSRPWYVLRTTQGIYCTDYTVFPQDAGTTPYGSNKQNDGSGTSTLSLEPLCVVFFYALLIF